MTSRPVGNEPPAVPADHRHGPESRGTDHGVPSLTDAEPRVDARHYQRIFEHCRIPLFLIAPATDRILDANRAACAMLGYPRAELLAAPISAIHPDEMPAMMAFAGRVIDEGSAWTDELSCRTKSGDRLPAEISATAIADVDSHLLVALVRPTAQREPSMPRGSQAAEWWRCIVESAMDGILATDDRLRVIFVNRAAAQAFDCPPERLRGQSLKPLLSDRFKKLLDECMEAFSASGWNEHYLWAEGLTAFCQDGKPFPVDVTVSPLHIDGQRYLTIVLRDITLRQQAEGELKRLRSENERLHELVRAQSETADIIGKSKAMADVLLRIDRVAPTDSTILILGETGTGKELIARCIHRLSQRRDATLVSLNCAALTPSLIESELFGHEKGAFTGALTRKLGRFELAHRGTLFLDEIGELPPDLQVKLLRVLQEGEFERVGGSSTLRVDVRVIAATNRDLEREVAAGRFRADLFYRLNVVPVALPPLRQRPEDIPLLALYFAGKYCKKIGRPITAISPQVMDTLKAYAWPGNVRELEHVIERGVILSPGERLDLGDWLPSIGSADTAVAGEPKTLEVMERDHILEALKLTGWRVSGANGAALRLGIKPTTLEARMKKLGIERPR